MDTFQLQIQKFVNDETHGSSYLLKEIIKAFTKHQPDTDEIRWAFKELKQINPTMVIIHHFLRTLEPKIDTNFQDHLQEYINQWQDVEERIATNLARILPKKELNVLTHSHSGMIIRVLGILQECSFHLNVWQTESFPGGEGKKQAECLSNFGFNVSILSDDQVKETCP